MTDITFEFLKHHQDHYKLSDSQFKLISIIENLEAIQFLQSLNKKEFLIGMSHEKLHELFYDLSVLTEKGIIVEALGDITFSEDFSEWLNKQLDIVFSRRL